MNFKIILIMKKLVLLLPVLSCFLLLSACSPKADYRVHDIWALRFMDKTPVNQRQGAIPSMELNLTRREIMGTDGCNEFTGPITGVGPKKISFGPLRGTDMTCPQAERSDRFIQALKETRSYARKELNLIFYDGEGQELLLFLKVD